MSNHRTHAIAIWAVIAAVASVSTFATWRVGRAASIDELKSSIEQKNAEIKRLEEEAARYRKIIGEKQQQGNTLKNELTRIANAIQQLRRDVAITQTKIGRTELEISKLSSEITTQESRIDTLRGGIAGAVRMIDDYDRVEVVSALFTYDRLSDILREFDEITTIKEQILTMMDDIRNVQRELGIRRAQAEEKKDELSDLKNSLLTSRSVQEQQESERKQLLAATKNQEKQYQELLKERERKRVALEEEINAIEEQLRVTIDPASLPPKRSGVLGGPLPVTSIRSCWEKGADLTKNCVTQFFGYTDFAKNGGYNGKGHNGSDFRANIGTPILAAEEGVVVDTGDTDTVNVMQNSGCKGASYGKWALIKHPNNLATLYAHMSMVSVSKGQQVSRGAEIGLSGKSGYATGPHLHFSVFAAKAVEIKTFPSKTCGRTLTVPVADPNWYLNPGDYL